MAFTLSKFRNPFVTFYCVKCYKSIFASQSPNERGSKMFSTAPSAKQQCFYFSKIHNRIVVFLLGKNKKQWDFIYFYIFYFKKEAKLIKLLLYLQNVLKTKVLFYILFFVFHTC